MTAIYTDFAVVPSASAPLGFRETSHNALQQKICKILCEKMYKCNESKENQVGRMQVTRDDWANVHVRGADRILNWKPIIHDMEGRATGQGDSRKVGFCRWAIYEQPAVASQNPTTLYVTFKGTDTWRDLKTDKNLAMYGESFEVDMAAGQALDALDNILRHKTIARTMVVFTGHSLGGNNAIMARERFTRGQRLVSKIKPSGSYLGTLSQYVYGRPDMYGQASMLTLHWATSKNRLAALQEIRDTMATLCIVFSPFVALDTARLLSDANLIDDRLKPPVIVWSPANDKVWQNGQANYSHMLKNQNNISLFRPYKPVPDTAEYKFYYCHLLENVQLFQS